ncbi:MAG TPA: tetratricopeptide repeat protein [Candidatus Obscuribacterales bacterium]
MRRKLCVAVSLFVAFSGNWSLVARAQSSASPETRLAQFEVILFGSSRSAEPLEQRLQALESNVFGQPKSGYVAARLDAIGQIVQPGSASTFMPPPAPGLDATGSTADAPPEIEHKHPPVDASPAETAQLSDLLRQGVDRFKQGRLDEAEQSFHRVIDHDRNNVHALYNLGAIAEQRGELADAHNYYSLALGINPADRQIEAALNEVSRELSERQASLSARGNGARTRPADSQAQAEREFALSAERTRREQQALREQQARLAGQARREQKARQRPAVPVIGIPQVSFTSGRRSGGSFLRSAAGVARAGTRFGLTAAAIHCPKCRRAIMGAQWLDIFGVRPNLR